MESGRTSPAVSRPGSPTGSEHRRLYDEAVGGIQDSSGAESPSGQFGGVPFGDFPGMVHSTPLNPAMMEAQMKFQLELQKMEMEERERERRGKCRGKRGRWRGNWKGKD